MKYWKYIILGLLVSIMLFHFGALYYIRNQNYELTSPDYYQKEIEHESLIEAMRQGHAFKWDLSYSDDNTFVFLKVTDANGEVAALEELSIQYDRPNNASFDQHIHLVKQESSHWAGQIEPLAAGRWNCLVTGRYQGRDIAWQQKLNMP